jgi:hypothetical protein
VWAARETRLAVPMDLSDPDAAHALEIERERSVGEILRAALSLYQLHPLLFLGLAVAVIAPFELGVLAATAEGPLSNGANESTGVSYLVIMLDYVLVGPLVSALCIQAVVLIGPGTRPGLAEVAVRGLRVLPVVAAAVIVSGLGILLGFLALIVPGIVLALRWAVVAQVAAIENEGWIPALRGSATLTRGRYWHVFGVLLLTGLLAGGVAAAAQTIPLGSTSGAASVAVGIAIRTITASFSALALSVLYFDLRARSGAAPLPRPGPSIGLG